MIVRDLRVESIARDLGIMPVDGEGDGGIAQDAEVEAVVGVFPDVLAADHHIFAEGLLESRMELIAETRLHGSGNAGAATEERIEDGVRAAGAGEHEILVEGCFQGARIGEAQHGGWWA